MTVQEQQRLNEAAEQFADTLVQSYQAVSELGVTTQERNVQLSEEFFNKVVSNLRTQADANLQLSEQIADQQQRQVEATRTMAQESVGAYMEFLNSIFSFAPGRVGRVQRWNESKHPRDFEGRFEGGEAWDESEHQRDAGGRFTGG
jgi:biopolymer transport protein ExbB/TolQ